MHRWQQSWSMKLERWTIMSITSTLTQLAQKPINIFRTSCSKSSCPTSQQPTVIRSDHKEKLQISWQYSRQGLYNQLAKTHFQKLWVSPGYLLTSMIPTTLVLETRRVSNFQKPASSSKCHPQPLMFSKWGYNGLSLRADLHNFGQNSITFYMHPLCICWCWRENKDHRRQLPHALRHGTGVINGTSMAKCRARTEGMGAMEQKDCV